MLNPYENNTGLHNAQLAASATIRALGMSSVDPVGKALNMTVESDALLAALDPLAGLASKLKRREASVQHLLDWAGAPITGEQIAASFQFVYSYTRAITEGHALDIYLKNLEDEHIDFIAKVQALKEKIKIIERQFDKWISAKQKTETETLQWQAFREEQQALRVSIDRIDAVAQAYKKEHTKNEQTARQTAELLVALCELANDKKIAQAEQVLYTARLSAVDVVNEMLSALDSTDERLALTEKQQTELKEEIEDFLIEQSKEILDERSDIESRQEEHKRVREANRFSEKMAAIPDWAQPIEMDIEEAQPIEMDIEEVARHEGFSQEQLEQARQSGQKEPVLQARAQEQAQEMARGEVLHLRVEDLVRLSKEKDANKALALLGPVFEQAGLTCPEDSTLLVEHLKKNEVLFEEALPLLSIEARNDLQEALWSNALSFSQLQFILTYHENPTAAASLLTSMPHDELASALSNLEQNDLALRRQNIQNWLNEHKQEAIACLEVLPPKQNALLRKQLVQAEQTKRQRELEQAQQQYMYENTKDAGLPLAAIRAVGKFKHFKKEKLSEKIKQNNNGKLSEAVEKAIDVATGIDIDAQVERSQTASLDKPAIGKLADAVNNIMKAQKVITLMTPSADADKAFERPLTLKENYDVLSELVLNLPEMLSSAKKTEQLSMQLVPDFNKTLQESLEEKLKALEESYRSPENTMDYDAYVNQLKALLEDSTLDASLNPQMRLTLKAFYRLKYTERALKAQLRNGQITATAYEEQLNQLLDSDPELQKDSGLDIKGQMALWLATKEFSALEYEMNKLMSEAEKMIGQIETNASYSQEKSAGLNQKLSDLRLRYESSLQRFQSGLKNAPDNILEGPISTPGRSIQAVQQSLQALVKAQQDLQITQRQGMAYEQQLKAQAPAEAAQLQEKRAKQLEMTAPQPEAPKRAMPKKVCALLKGLLEDKSRPDADARWAPTPFSTKP